MKKLVAMIAVLFMLMSGSALACDNYYNNHYGNAEQDMFMVQGIVTGVDVDVWDQVSEDCRGCEFTGDRGLSVDIDMIAGQSMFMSQEVTGYGYANQNGQQNFFLEGNGLTLEMNQYGYQYNNGYNSIIVTK